MSKIKLEVGMEVYCAAHGKGVVLYTDNDKHYPILVKYPAPDPQSSDATESYSPNGAMFCTLNPTLKPLNVPFTKGMEVECLIYGKGVIESVSVSERLQYPIGVLFEVADGFTDSYTIDGRTHRTANQTLFPQFTI